MQTKNLTSKKAVGRDEISKTCLKKHAASYKARLSENYRRDTKAQALSEGLEDPKNSNDKKTIQ